MISPASRSHKSLAAAWCAVLLASALLAGCGARSDHGAAATPAAVDATALTAWLDLADRLAAGESPAADAFDALYGLPAYRLSFGDSRRPDFGRPALERVLRRTFSPDPEPDRTLDRGLLANTRYLADHRDEARGLGDRLAAQDLPASIQASVRPLLPSGVRLDSLRVLLMAATPAVSWSPPRSLIVDAGLALAAGDQLSGLLAAALHRQLVPAPDVAAAPSGRQALLATLSRLHRQGVAAFLQGGSRLEFDHTHPVLGAAPPGDPVRAARDALTRMQAMLTTLADPAHADELERNGGAVDAYLRPGNLYDDLGAAMASLIRGHLDDAAWRRAAAGDAAAWFAAYQQAALAAQGPNPLPAFAAADWTHLQALLSSSNREVTP